MFERIVDADGQSHSLIFPLVLFYIPFFSLSPPPLNNDRIVIKPKFYHYRYFHPVQFYGKTSNASIPLVIELDVMERRTVTIKKEKKEKRMRERERKERGRERDRNE